MFLRRRLKVKQEYERRAVFMRYLGEVANAVSALNGSDRDTVYANLLRVAERKTKEADARFDKHGRRIETSNEFGDNVLIVTQDDPTPLGAASA
jgi:DNA topoisomerase-6 subunit B